MYALLACVSEIKKLYSVWRNDSVAGRHDTNTGCPMPGRSLCRSFSWYNDFISTTLFFYVATSEFACVYSRGQLNCYVKMYYLALFSATCHYMGTGMNSVPPSVVTSTVASVVTVISVDITTMLPGNKCRQMKTRVDFNYGRNHIRR